jgi:uncharacterized protein YjbI with pentapeptide repeats
VARTLRTLRERHPEERTDIVLRLIEQHPEGKLELPERNGVRATLEKIDLSYNTLKARRAQWQNGSPPWWNDMLPGVDMESANRQKANLWGANLQKTYLVNATLQEAILFEANLQRASFLYPNLQGAFLDKANLQWQTISR